MQKISLKPCMYQQCDHETSCQQCDKVSVIMHWGRYRRASALQYRHHNSGLLFWHVSKVSPKNKEGKRMGLILGSALMTCFIRRHCKAASLQPIVYSVLGICMSLRVVVAHYYYRSIYFEKAQGNSLLLSLLCSFIPKP